MQYNREMGDLVTLLKPLIDKLPWWVPTALAVLPIIGGAFKGFWEIRKTRAEARKAELDLKERRDKERAELAASREKERSVSTPSEFPQFTPVSKMTWYVAIAFAIANGWQFVSMSISGPLTTMNVAAMGLNFFAAIWCFSTPLFITLLRHIAHAQRVHLYLVEFSLHAEHELLKTMLSGQKETVIQICKDLLNANHEALVQILKQLEEMKRGDKAEE